LLTEASIPPLHSGAKLRTISPIRKLGTVILRLPDLTPLSCQLRWSDAYHAGVMFEMPLPEAEFRQWAEGRLSLLLDRIDPFFAEAEPDHSFARNDLMAGMGRICH
jgi:hypothetical protein